MIIRRVGTSMTTVVAFARDLERRERARVSSLAIARQNVARRLRVGVGTFENLVRDRVKRIDATIRDRLQELLVSELEQEISRLTHELEMARQSGAHPASQHVGEIETYLEKARALLRGEAAQTELPE
jgi:hypothetical protein